MSVEAEYREYPVPWEEGDLLFLDKAQQVVHGHKRHEGQKCVHPDLL